MGNKSEVKSKKKKNKKEEVQDDIEEIIEEEIEPDREQWFKDKITKLERKLREAYRSTNLAEELRERCFDLSKKTPDPPNWLVKTEDRKNHPGTPTLFLSDWHWAEVVNPGEVNNKNAYNLSIAHERARHVIEGFVEVTHKHLASSYDKMVLCLGGDMVSGSIHDELTATNEKEIMPAVLDIVDILTWAIKQLKLWFPKIFIPCVTGNHGRYTMKIRMKQRNHTSFDWLIYTFLEKIFKDDKDIVFYIPEGPDALYRLHNTTYLLTHGDMLGRGGDGLIGSIGPITRGDHKRRTRNSGLGLQYDVLLCGHFHQLMMLRSRIVNGSLKGLDEYSFTQAFGYEVPMQACWWTHPRRGITMASPIFCQNGEVEEAILEDEKAWVSYHVGKKKKSA